MSLPSMLLLQLLGNNRISSQVLHSMQMLQLLGSF